MKARPTAFLPTFALPRSLRTRPRKRRGICASAATPSITDVATDVRSGNVSATAILETALRRIHALEPAVGAFLHVDAEAALSCAAEVDRRVKNGIATGLLAGVPIAVKDNLCTAGLPTTAASAILDGFTPAYSAAAVAKLEAAGAVILGKTNMDEFGMGSSTETSAYQSTRNPWDVTRVPGGSSGGSASAVGSGECSAALGSDTGGSIRQPAGFCGVTGLKPSYGRVSRHGLMAYASSFDTVGPICRSVADAALMLQVIAGRDPMDATTVESPVPNYWQSLPKRADLTGVSVGVLQEAMGAGVDGEVAQCVSDAVEVLKQMGAKVQNVSLPKLSVSTAAYYVLATSEASANLARYDGVRYGVRDMAARNSSELYARSRAQGFGSEVKKRVMVGTYALSSGYYDAYYLQAQRVRSLVVRDFNNVFVNGIDVLVSPVSPSTAFKLGAKAKDPLSMYMDDFLTVPASLAGLPALSVPCGFSSSKLPIGMQIMGPFLQEERILQVGHAFQLATQHHMQTAQVVEDSVRDSATV